MAEYKNAFLDAISSQADNVWRDRQLKMQLANQLFMHNTMTPYEAGQLRQNQANQDRLWKEQLMQADETKRLHDAQIQEAIGRLMGNGDWQPANQSQPGNITLGSQSFSPVPYAQRPGNFTIHPPKELQDTFGLPSSVVGNAEHLSGWGPIFNAYANERKAAEAAKALEPQRAQMIEYINRTVAKDDPIQAELFRSRMISAATPQQIESVQNDLGQYHANYSPSARRRKNADAISQAIGIDQGKKAADRAQNEAEAPQIYDWMMKTGMNPANALSRMDKQGVKDVINFWMSHPDKYKLPEWLTPQAQQGLMTLDNVEQQAKELKAIFERKDPKTGKALKDEDTVLGNIPRERLMYALGVQNDEQLSQLINKLEIFAPQAAGRIAKQGGVNALQYIEKVGVHTPNAHKDSGKVIQDKLDNIIHIGDLQRANFRKYGNKFGMVQSGEAPLFDSDTGGPAKDVEFVRGPDGKLIPKE